MLTLHEIQTIADTGMLVVLWMAQLVIYPSFLRVEVRELLAWHKKYTFRVSFIIMPLMFTQLGSAIMFAIYEGRLIDWLALALILICWALTFFVSVPLHRKIDQGACEQDLRHRLIATNWPRTVLWSAIFFLGLF